MFRLWLILIVVASILVGSYLLKGKQSKEIIAFIRDGDVWLAYTDGSIQEKVTSHEEVKYKYRNYINGEFIGRDFGDEFHKSPTISKDGKYTMFLVLSEDYLKKINDWKNNVEFFSDYDPNYSEFDPPEKSYELKMLDLSNKAVSPIPLKNQEAKNEYGNFNSLSWAKNKDIFGFIKDFNLHTLSNIGYRSGSYNSEAKFSGEFCGLDCGSESDGNYFIRISPDGEKILSSYQFFKVPVNCNNTVGSKIRINNIVTDEIFLVPTDANFCSGNIGDWFSNSLDYIFVEYFQENKNKTIIDFVKRRYGTNNSKTFLFQDNEYQWGPILISMEDNWIIYSIGENKYGSTGKVDFRVRNFVTLEYFDLLDITNKRLNTDMDRVMHPNWDGRGEVLYFELSDNNPQKEKMIIRFNIRSKDVKTVLNNAEQPSVSY
ncbi:MAG: hypothetical protein WD988_02675 [Candidatus Curtissbacteria bacterium]